MIATTQHLLTVNAEPSTAHVDIMVDMDEAGIPARKTCEDTWLMVHRIFERAHSGSKLPELTNICSEQVSQRPIDGHMLSLEEQQAFLIASRVEYRLQSSLYRQSNQILLDKRSMLPQLLQNENSKSDKKRTISEDIKGQIASITQEENKYDEDFALLQDLLRLPFYVKLKEKIIQAVKDYATTLQSASRDSLSVDDWYRIDLDGNGHGKGDIFPLFDPKNVKILSFSEMAKQCRALDVTPSEIPEEGDDWDEPTSTRTSTDEVVAAATVAEPDITQNQWRRVVRSDRPNGKDLFLIAPEPSWALKKKIVAALGSSLDALNDWWRVQECREEDKDGKMCFRLRVDDHQHSTFARIGDYFFKRGTRELADYALHQKYDLIVARAAASAAP